MMVTSQKNALRRTGTERGYLSEMFCSIQGEGPFVGERHVFVRTAGCAESCSWCDTVYSKIHTPRFVVHDDGAGTKRTLENPVSIDRVMGELLDFVANHQPVGTVSITGGEPLEQPAFVRALAERLRSGGLRVYLETNGVHAGPLSAIIPYVDVVAMDIKLPSAVGVEKWDDHRRFLEVAVAGNGARASVFVKVVMDSNSRLEEIQTAVEVIGGVDRRIPLVLQAESATLLAPGAHRDGARRLLEQMHQAQRMAMTTLDSVRVMPQLHKILGVR